MIFAKGIMHMQMSCGSHGSSQEFMVSFTVFILNYYQEQNSDILWRREKAFILSQMNI